MSTTNVTPLVPKASAPEIERPCFRVYDELTTTKAGQKLRAGVYWHGLRHGKGDSEPAEFDQWICSPLHVVAITSCEGGHFGRLLRFRNTLGRWREWAMPMAMLKGSGEDLRGELLGMGVEIDPDGFKQLNRYIQSQHPKRQVTAATATGWHDAQLFIMPGENIGQGDAILQTEAHDLGDFTKAGNLDGWLGPQPLFDLSRIPGYRASDGRYIQPGEPDGWPEGNYPLRKDVSWDHVRIAPLAVMSGAYGASGSGLFPPVSSLP